VSARHDGPQTLSLERVTTHPSPVIETKSIWVEDPSGFVPVYPEVNTQTEVRQPVQAEEEQVTQDEEEQPVRTEEQWSVQTDPDSGRTSASRIRPPLRFYTEGLTGCPMEGLTTVIPEGFMPNVGRTTLERFAKLLLHSQLSIWFYFFFRTCVLAFADLSLSFFS